MKSAHPSIGRLALSLGLAISSLPLLPGCGAASDDSDSSLGTSQERWTSSGSGQCSAAGQQGCWSIASHVQQGPGAVQGYPNLSLPVCRASYGGVWHPGKIWRTQCLFEYGGHGYAAGDTAYGRTTQVPTFETLEDDGRYSWVSINHWNGVTYIADPLPNNAIVGGVSGGVQIGVCMVLAHSDWHVGKYWANGCNIEWSTYGEHYPVSNSSSSSQIYLLTHS